MRDLELDLFLNFGWHVLRALPSRYGIILFLRQCVETKRTITRASDWVKTSIRFFDDGPPYSACGSVLSVSPVSKHRRFQFHKRRQLFIARTTKRFPSLRCASAIQIVRPSESMADTQSQLQPTLLRL